VIARTDEDNLWSRWVAPDLEEHPVVEESEMSEMRRKSPEELQASRFAGDVVLDGRAEELAEKCVEVARNSVERLKGAVPHVAKQAGVSVETLANYMAFRLSLQGINWWGAATNLQEDGVGALCSPPLVSGHKLNRGNWLASSIASNWEATSKTAVEMGIFSKSVTLRICRSL
jgi:hypothetical protein